MAGNLPPGVRDIDVDMATWDDDLRPCDWEKFSGECLVCGARIGEPCEWEDEQLRRKARR